MENKELLDQYIQQALLYIKERLKGTEDSAVESANFIAGVEYGLKLRDQELNNQ